LAGIAHSRPVNTNATRSTLNNIPHSTRYCPKRAVNAPVTKTERDYA
jgi:hypothetical protein